MEPINLAGLDTETENRIADLGHITISGSAVSALEQNGSDLLTLLKRYAYNDYGNVSLKEAGENDAARFTKDKVCQARYELPDGTKLQVLTAWGITITQVTVEGEEPETE